MSKARSDTTKAIPLCDFCNVDRLMNLPEDSPQVTWYGLRLCVVDVVTILQNFDWMKEP